MKLSDIQTIVGGELIGGIQSFAALLMIPERFSPAVFSYAFPANVLTDTTI